MPLILKKLTLATSAGSGVIFRPNVDWRLVYVNPSVATGGCSATVAVTVIDELNSDVLPSASVAVATIKSPTLRGLVAAIDVVKFLVLPAFAPSYVSAAKNNCPSCLSLSALKNSTRSG